MKQLERTNRKLKWSLYIFMDVYGRHAWRVNLAKLHASSVYTGIPRPQCFDTLLGYARLIWAASRGSRQAGRLYCSSLSV